MTWNHHEIQGCDIVAIIQTPEEAIAFRIVYEKEEPETWFGGRIGIPWEQARRKRTRQRASGSLG